MPLFRFTAASIALSAGVAAAQAVPGHAVVPLRHMSAQRTGTWIEKVWGDPGARDVPFVFRIHNEAGYVVLPHVHPMDENIVIVEGRWSLGTGKRFDRSALTTMDVGAFGFVPKTMAHFAWSQQNTIIQVHGIGPFVSTLVDSVYELSDRGINAKLSLLAPGVAVAAAPAHCFDLSLGMHVRATRGAGVIVGAQCSPANDFTQYRVKRGDGTFFWAVGTDLTKR